MLKLNGYGGPQAKANEKRLRFKGWETLVLYTKNNYLIKRLLQVPFLYTGGDMSTLNSRLVVIQGGYKLYESRIILSKEDIGLQNNITGWIVPEKQNDL